MDAVEIQKRARKRLAVLERKRRDPRYQRVIGRLARAGLLTTSDRFAPASRPMTRLAIEDVLWAGEVEPRVLELLPALIVKRPALFRTVRDLPEDLARVVGALRRNQTPEDFRGLPGGSLSRWVSQVGHKDKLPSQLRSFRLQTEDLALLDELSTSLGISQTATIRRGLRALARQAGDAAPPPSERTGRRA